MPLVNIEKNLVQLECCLFFVVDEIPRAIKVSALVTDGKSHYVYPVFFVAYNIQPIDQFYHRSGPTQSRM